MNRIHIFITLAGLLSAHYVSSEMSTTTKDLAEANQEFAWDLYDVIAELAEGRNVFFSPLSVSLALGMTYSGARGNTKSQMAEVLNFDYLDSDSELNQAFQGLIDTFNRAEKNYTLEIANGLFGSKGFNFKQDFLNLTQMYFHAGLEELDFVDAPESSRAHMNEWVEQKTNQKIKDLLPRGSISPATVLVLINAIYFKGNWSLPFDSGDTKPKPFHAIDGKDVNMDLMSIEENFNYNEVPALESQVIELPYDGDEVSMFIILPKERHGLADLEEKLLDFNLAEMEDKLVSTTVQVTLPKFKLTQEVNLKSILMELGMEDLFIPNKCNLSGMNGRQNIVVTEVVHKGYLEVNEEGSEAAGATGVIFFVETANIETPKFIADHPFVFYIKEKMTGSMLFVGRLTTSPNSTAVVGSFGYDVTSVGTCLTLSWICFVMSVMWVIMMLRD